MTKAPNDWNTRNAEVIEEFRANDGKFVSHPSRTVLLLHTVGAKSGQTRINPLAYLAGEECLYVFASKGGSPGHPDWYHNLVANPGVEVEVGTERYEAVAEPLTGAERDAVFADQVKLRPNFGEYQEKTSRIIPVVALRRA